MRRTTRIGRRGFLRAGLGTIAGVLAAPALVGRALSAPGELNYMGWSGYKFDDLFARFTDQTGIRVNFLEQPDQDFMLAQARLMAPSSAADIAEPSLERLDEWVGGDLVQAWDDGNISIDSYDKAFLTRSGMVKGRRYFLPVVWGADALTYSIRQAPLDYGKASLADLFGSEYAGRVTLKADMVLPAIGRMLEERGALPRPWRDGYADEGAMRSLWDIALAEAVRHKSGIARYWTSDMDAQSAFRDGGCALGLTWDSTGQALSGDGFGFLAPREGAFGWLQGYVLLKAARNVAQAHEWARFMATPEASAAYASAFSANPVASGAIDLMDGPVREFCRKAYPADALTRIWWWPVRPAWFGPLRDSYTDRWLAA